MEGKPNRLRWSATSLSVAAVMVMSIVGAPMVQAAAEGPAFSWGDGSIGQLGNGQSGVGYQVSSPVGVVNSEFVGKAVTDVSAGYSSSCAIASGAAYCWGSNWAGQLGDDSTDDSSVPVPVDTSGVLAGKTLTAISVGRQHTCALADGRAYCWGYGDMGALGNDSTDDSSVPVAVDTSGVLAGKTVTAISAGSNYTCAVADGRSYCWGYDGPFGVLGNDDAGNSNVPVAVDTNGVLGGKTVTEISAGDVHACVVADGGAYCWGFNRLGGLGNNSDSNSGVPVAVDTNGVLGGKTVSAISAGYTFTCSVADRQAYCWGNDGRGQLGDGKTQTTSPVPVAVDTNGVLGGKTVQDISASTDGPSNGPNACAVADDAAYCWGVNTDGQVGDGTTADRSSPVAVQSDAFGGVPVSQVSTGGSHTVAVLAPVPDAPRDPKATAGDASATVEWAPPASDGGLPVTGYTVTARTVERSAPATCTTAATSCRVTGLTNGVTYTFDVVATNGAGNSAPATTNAVTPVAGPSPAPTPTPTPTPVHRKAQKPTSAKGRPPRLIEMDGVTRITGSNARTNAGQLIRTRVRCRPQVAVTAGEERYCTVIRGARGRVSLRTYGYPDLRVVVVQYAPQTSGFRAYRKRSVYVDGVKK